MDVSDKVIQELLGKESIIRFVEVLCNIWISRSATSSFLQCLIFDVKVAKLMEVMTEAEMNIHFVIVERSRPLPCAANH